MSNNVTLADIELQAREHADMVNSKFLSDAEWIRFINASYSELYDLIVSRFEDYYTLEQSFTIAQGDATNALPSDFYKLRGVDRSINGPEDFVTVLKFNWSERNWRNRSIQRVVTGQVNLSYRIVKDTLRIIPEDQAPGDYRLWYVPTFTRLVNSTDTLDGVNGWEEYIIIRTAIMALDKEETDSTLLVAALDGLKERIEDMAQNRDIDQPEVIADTQRTDWDLDHPF